MATKVIHIKDAPAGWRENSNYVFIGRPGKWGNPFTVQEYGQDRACNEHAGWFPHQKELVARLGELKDKVLVCYCRPAKRCHGDLLSAMADKGE